VNVFRGRLDGGRAVIGGLSLAMPDHPTASVPDATLYVRPHELEIERRLDGRSGLRARVERVNPAGSIAKVGLSSPEQEQEIQVDLSRDRYEDLALAIGEEVYVVPKRVRVFMPEYVI
jgi:sulfate transport system ATP-binding protein